MPPNVVHAVMAPYALRVRRMADFLTCMNEGCRTLSDKSGSRLMDYQFEEEAMEQITNAEIDLFEESKKAMYQPVHKKVQTILINEVFKNEMRFDVSVSIVGASASARIPFE
jgi:hypothetical protein